MSLRLLKYVGLSIVSITLLGILLFVSGRWWLPQLATQLTGQQLKIEQLDYQLNLPNNLQISQFTGQYQQQQINIKHANIHFSLWPLLSFNWPKMTAVDVANIDITINSKVLAQQLQQPSHSQSTPFTLEQFNQLLAELPDSKIDKLSLFIDQQNTPQWQLHHFAWQQGKVQAWLYWQQQALAIIHSQLSQQDWQVNAHIPVMNNLNMLRCLANNRISITNWRFPPLIYNNSQKSARQQPLMLHLILSLRSNKQLPQSPLMMLNSRLIRLICRF